MLTILMKGTRTYKQVNNVANNSQQKGRNKRRQGRYVYRKSELDSLNTKYSNVRITL